MEITLKDAFVRRLKNCDASDQVKFFQITLTLAEAFANPKRHAGIGLRKIGREQSVWEVRIGLGLRAVFRLEKNHAVFGFLGSHDEVRRYMETLR